MRKTITWLTRAMVADFIALNILGFAWIGTHNQFYKTAGLFSLFFGLGICLSIGVLLFFIKRRIYV